MYSHLVGRLSMFEPMYFSSRDVKTVILLAILVYVGPARGETEEAPWRLTLEWQLDAGFESPESVVHDELRQRIYVSNVNGYEENGKGFLSALNVHGELVELEWIRGLNAPTGMAISNDTLYVVDFNRLLEIDIPSRRIRARYPSPDKNPGLNDVAIDPAGSVFVSGSASNTIYRLSDGELRRWAHSDDLKFANGLHADGRFLYVSGYYLRRIELETMDIQNVGLDLRLHDLESIEPDGMGGYFITQIGNRPIMHWSEDGVLTSVLSRSTYSADVDFIVERKLLIVPSGGNRIAGFSASFAHESKERG